MGGRVRSRPGRNVRNQTKAEYLEAVDLLNQAVARDPSFLDAYCQLAYAHDWLYFGGGNGLDHTPARLALAEAAIQGAARLNPHAGETHLARAQNLYWGYLDYHGALAELETARQTLPNDFRVPRLMGHIQRRQGHCEESTRNLDRSAELNPRNIETRVAIAINYTFLRRYADLKSALASTLAVFPNDLDTAYWPAYVEFQAKADTRPLHQMIDSIRATNPTPTPDIAEWWLACALAERDTTAAKNASDAHGENSIDLGAEVFLSRSFVEGFIARMTKDPLQGVRRVTNLAMIAAWVGDKDLAFEQLESIIRRPSALSYGGLKLFPWWDPLRGDSRFEKLLDEAKQPVVVK